MDPGWRRCPGGEAEMLAIPDAAPSRAERALIWSIHVHHLMWMILTGHAALATPSC